MSNLLLESVREVWNRPRLWWFMAIYGLIALLTTSGLDYFFSPTFVHYLFVQVELQNATFLRLIVATMFAFSLAIKVILGLYLSAALVRMYEEPHSTVRSALWRAILQPGLLLFALFAALYGYYQLFALMGVESVVRLPFSLQRGSMYLGVILFAFIIPFIIYQLFMLFVPVVAWRVTNPIEMLKRNLQTIWRELAELIVSGGVYFLYMLVINFDLRLGLYKLASELQQATQMPLVMQAIAVTSVTYLCFCVFLLIPMTAWVIFLVKVYNRAH